jgi:hypothetical protein
VIAGLLFHLKITELLLKCTYCVDGRLVADLEVTCFQGQHVFTFSVAVVLLLCFSLGYPLVALVMMCRAQHQGQEGQGEEQGQGQGQGQGQVKGEDKVKAEPQLRRALTKAKTMRFGRTISITGLRQAAVRSSFGVLLDDVKQSHYWFHCVQFLHNWGLALLVTLDPAPDVKLFCMANLDLAIITFVFVRRPFIAPEDNRTVLSFKFVAALQSIVLLVLAMLLTLPLPPTDLPVWLEVPPPSHHELEVGDKGIRTRTVLFAVLPSLWLVAVGSFLVLPSVKAVCRGCFLKAHVHNEGPSKARSQQGADQGEQSMAPLMPSLSSLAFALDGTKSSISTSGVMQKRINNDSSSSINHDSNIERQRQQRHQQRRQKHQLHRKQLPATTATTTTTTIASTIMTNKTTTSTATILRRRSR